MSQIQTRSAGPDSQPSCDPHPRNGVLVLSGYRLHIGVERGNPLSATEWVAPGAEVAMSLTWPAYRNHTLWILITLAGQGRFWVITAEIITAELWSLALAERFHDATLEAQGSREDPTVQRVTELELGVRIPTAMRLRHGVPGDMPDDKAALIAIGCRRLGMNSAANSNERWC
jgi:hypothetical protein